MRISAFGLMGLLFDMMFLLDEARHVLSHYQMERNQVLDLLYDYIHHHHRNHHHHSSSSQDVLSKHPAADGFTTAYLFQGSNRSVEVSRSMLQNVKSLLRTSSGFTIVMSLRQEPRNVGSVLSIGTDNQTLLEVESSGWRNELRFSYAHKSTTRVEIFPYSLADGQWHSVALSVTGATHINVFIDCKLVFERQIQQLRMDLIDWDKTHLWMGQRNTRHVYFKGAMEYLKLVASGEGYLEQCPFANVACPTCGQFQQLQQSVQQLHSAVSELTKQLSQANQRILELEKCECRKQCTIDGRVYQDGEEVRTKVKCSVCKCKGGALTCEQRVCPRVGCKNAIILKNQCCPICPQHCYFFTKSFQHDEEFRPNPCVICKCNNGKMPCKNVSCSKAPCPKAQRILLPDACCKVCNGTDYCSANHITCPENSTCMNLLTTHSCECNQGFERHPLGKSCVDIDECRTKGGTRGHQCHDNSKCMNTVGSYYCECLPGFSKVNQFMCREVDMCEQVGRNVCHANAECINVPGSFKCECADGFEGNGTHCQPVCSEPCRNGGSCVYAGVCRCRQGYRGRNCDTDIDECSEGIQSCSRGSVCVNTPGSYYCRCLEGYHSSRPDNERGALCLDLDECQGWGGGQRCPASAVCENTIGGYECRRCLGNSSCSPGCSVDGKHYDNGETWQSQKEPCATCKCQNGKVTCENKFRECSQNHNTSTASSHQCCVGNHTCRHQELPLTYTTGQTWRYQCRVCQCNAGETDCWPVECPKLDCRIVVHDEGTCCPRCLDMESCSLESLANSSSSDSMATCTVGGQVVQHQHTWKPDSDPCSLCECLNGTVCCSYDHLCSVEGRVPSSRLQYHNWRTYQQHSSTERSRTRTGRPTARTRPQEQQMEDKG